MRPSIVWIRLGLQVVVFKLTSMFLLLLLILLLVVIGRVAAHFLAVVNIGDIFHNMGNPVELLLIDGFLARISFALNPSVCTLFDLPSIVILVSLDLKAVSEYEYSLYRASPA